MTRVVSWTVTVAALAISGVAWASPGSIACKPVSPWLEYVDELLHITPECVPTPSTTLQVPEIDPASTIGAVTLLLGGLVVLRGRRSRS